MGAQDRRYRKTETMINGAMVTLLKDFSYEEITFPDLISKADINRSTFYLHYPSLDAVVGSIEDQAVVLISNFLSQHGKDEPSVFGTAFYELIQTNKNLFLALSHAASSRLDEKLINLVASFFGVEAPSKAKKTMDDSYIRLAALEGQIQGILVGYLWGNMKLDQGKFVQLIAQVLASPCYSQCVNAKMVSWWKDEDLSSSIKQFLFGFALRLFYNPIRARVAKW